MDSAPIVVNESPAPDQLIVGVRQVILILSAAATATGAHHLGSWMGQMAVAAGPIASLAVVIAGQIHIRHQGQKLAIMANALPDSIAQVKS